MTKTTCNLLTYFFILEYTEIEIYDFRAKTFTITGFGNTNETSDGEFVKTDYLQFANVNFFPPGACCASFTHATSIDA